MIIMIPSILVCLLASILHKVQSSEETLNTTTLYPVNTTTVKEVTTEESVNNTSETPETTTSKELNETEHGNESEGLDKVNTKSETATWKIDAILCSTKSHEERGKELTQEKSKEESSSHEKSKFKPSQQLGTFYDEDAFVIPTTRSIDSFKPMKPNSFSSNSFFKLDYKPKLVISSKPFENSYSKPNQHENHLETKPTDEIPVKVPAGSLYNYPDPFKEKPGAGDDDFGLEFNDGKNDGKTEVKKYKNLWHGLLNLVTALLPIGIIVSALAPNIVTLHTTDNNNINHHFSRRSDSLPSISEQCKRRLLCEIHSERNYVRKPGARQKYCYKIQCEDPDAMNKLLTWLLSHRNTR